MTHPTNGSKFSITTLQKRNIALALVQSIENHELLSKSQLKDYFLKDDLNHDIITLETLVKEKKLSALVCSLGLHLRSH